MAGGNAGGGAATALTVIDVATYAGADLAAKLAAALAAAPAGGAILDCGRLTGAQAAASTVTVNKPVEIILGACVITVSAGPFIDVVLAGSGSIVRGSGEGDSIIRAAGGVTPILRATGAKDVTFANLTVEYTSGNAANIAINLVQGAAPLQGAVVRECHLLGFGAVGIAIQLDKAHRVGVFDCLIENFGVAPVNVVDYGVDSAMQFSMTGCQFEGNALTIPHNWYQSAKFGEDKIADQPGPNMPVYGGWYLFQFNRVTYETTQPIETLEAALFLKGTSPMANLSVALVGVSYVHTGAVNVTGGTAGTYGTVEYTGSGTLSFARGVDGNVAHKGSGVISNAEAFRSHIDIDVGGTGNILNAYGFHAYAPVDAGPGGGTITNWYGVYINDPASGSLIPTAAYAIYTAGGHVFFTTPTDASAFIVDGASGRIFMGAPIDGGATAKLTVAQTVTATSGGRLMLAFTQTNNPIADSTATVRTLSSTATIPSANIRNTGFMSGVTCEANHAGSGIAAETVGCEALATHTGGGTSSAAQGVFAAARNTGLGTVTLGAAFHAAPPVNSGGGVYSTWYGLLIDDPGSVVTPTSAYAIYASGGRIEFTNNVRFVLNGKAHTAQSAAELIDVNWNLGRTVQFTTGATIALQRAFLISEPTYSATAATQTITDAATFAVPGAPIAGTNVTIANSYACLFGGRTKMSVAGIQLELARSVTGASVTFELTTNNDIQLRTGARTSADGGSLRLNPFASTDGTLRPAFDVGCAAHTGVTSDDADIVFSTTRTITYAAAGAPVTYRSVTVGRPTLSSASAQTITDAANVYIVNAPISGGSITITNAYAIWVDSGKVRFDDGLLIGGEPVGQAGFVSYTNTVDNTANSSGVGTIKMKGTTSRDSSGFLKILDGTTARFIPYFDAITG